MVVCAVNDSFGDGPGATGSTTTGGGFKDEDIYYDEYGYYGDEDEQYYEYYGYYADDFAGYEDYYDVGGQPRCRTRTPKRTSGKSAGHSITHANPGLLSCWA